MLARGQTLIITVQDVVDEEETSFNEICQPDQHHTECDSPKIKRKVGSEVKKKKILPCNVVESPALDDFRPR